MSNKNQGRVSPVLHPDTTTAEVEKSVEQIPDCSQHDHGDIFEEGLLHDEDQPPLDLDLAEQSTGRDLCCTP